MGSTTGERTTAPNSPAPGVGEQSGWTGWAQCPSQWAASCPVVTLPPLQLLTSSPPSSASCLSKWLFHLSQPLISAAKLLRSPLVARLPHSAAEGRLETQTQPSRLALCPGPSPTAFSAPLILLLLPSLPLPAPTASQSILGSPEPTSNPLVSVFPGGRVAAGAGGQRHQNI